MKEKRKRINNEIVAKNVQLIDESGQNVGVMSLNDALKKANDSGLDLMEIGRNKDLVITKIIDYGKHLYKLKKQEQKNKQKSKTPELKTLRITFNIGEHDLGVKKKQAIGFAKDGNPIRITLMLKGRERQYEDLAKTKLLNFAKSLEDIYKIERDVSKSGNILNISLKPIK